MRYYCALTHSFVIDTYNLYNDLFFCVYICICWVVCLQMETIQICFISSEVKYILHILPHHFYFLFACLYLNIFMSILMRNTISFNCLFINNALSSGLFRV
jgi:hypothetical protein